MAATAALLAASVVLVVTAWPAYAGPPALEDSGRFLILQGDVVPPRAATATGPRAVAVQFESFTGNIKTGESPTGPSAFRLLEYRTPQGLRFNHAAFPRCRLEVLDKSGPTSCPRGSQIGTGRVIVDARPLFPDFVRVAQALVFNGTYGSGGVRPSILLWNKVGGITATIPADVRKAQPGFGPTFLVDNGPVPAGLPITPVSLSLTFPKRSTRVKGRTVSLFEAPSTCRGSWRWRQSITDRAGRTIIATHETPCLPAGQG